MTRLLKAEIHTFVSEERKLYHNPSMSPIPQKLTANYSIRGQSIAFDIYSGAPRIWQKGVHNRGSGSVARQLPEAKRACSECSHYKQCKNIIAAYV